MVDNRRFRGFLADGAIVGSLQFLNLHDLRGQVMKAEKLASSGCRDIAC